ncbi:hypothetical protein FOZ63_023937 [Perkinsus olseni]|uniref:Uncharacterized protein n=1 Tax=Perkinsus olseni TaxID=32597 RepID=A0A7J6STP9_PEROL|nr:hypothetical protein FOZ63_023937 [Perkinsus olseni]KAF4736241.1 hypothetical protein FOZ62_009098 [Perkinsus olseni]
MAKKLSRRSALCLHLKALDKAYGSSESGLLWTSWSFLGAPIPTLVPLYTVHREGFICGMDSLGRSSVLLSSQPQDGEDIRIISGHNIDTEEMGVVVDKFEVDRIFWSLSTDGEILYYPEIDARRNCMVRLSLSSGDCVGVIPAPPNGGGYGNLTDVHCVSNGQLFMYGFGGRKLFRTRLPPLSEYVVQSAEARLRPIEGVEWEAVADLPSNVANMDVIARDDGKFKLVCVGFNSDYIRYVDYEGNESVGSLDEVSMCKFVPSYDEFICVAARHFSDELTWDISLIDVTDMSVVFSVDSLCDIGSDPYVDSYSYLAITQDDLVIVAQQISSDEEAFYEFVVSRLQCSIA